MGINRLVASVTAALCFQSLFGDALGEPGCDYLDEPRLHAGAVNRQFTRACHV